MFLVILTTLFIAWLFHELYWKRRNYPPGPVPLPLIGNILTMIRHQPGYQAFLQWKQQYGPVHTFWLGTQPMVLLSNYRVIKEQIIQRADLYTDRHDMGGMAELMRGGMFGIIFSNDELWRSQRRFALSTMRDFGMGKNLMEQKVLVEVNTVLDRLATADGPFSISNEVDIAIGSIINNLVFGYRYSGERREEFFKIKRELQQLFKLLGSPTFTLIGFGAPWMRHLPGFSGTFKEVVRRFGEMAAHFQKEIDAHRAVIDLNDEESDDLVDAYLKEQHRRRDEPAHGGFTDLQFRNVVFDLWIAGQETTSTTTSWALLHLLRNPAAQERMAAELEREIDADRVTLADRPRLPYCNAVIMETQRCANILALNLTRVVSEDVVIDGYLVKKGTTVVPQICVPMVDPDVFEQPDQFIPERFIDENGGLKKVDELMPFSCGKRQCAGEGLARLELFLFITNIIKHYKVLPVDPDNLPSIEKTSRVATPIPFLVRVEKRN